MILSHLNTRNNLSKLILTINLYSFKLIPIFKGISFSLYKFSGLSSIKIGEFIICPGLFSLSILYSIELIL